MLEVIKTAAAKWSEHRSARLGAALAYYSVFSLGPLLLIVTSVAGLLFGGEEVRRSLIAQFRELLGDTGSRAVEAMLASANEGGTGLAAVAGVSLLLIAALGVVVQLKDALNTIWEVPETVGSGVWYYVRTYLVSLAGVLALGFLLATSLVISAALSSISTWLGIPDGASIYWQALNFAVSLAVLSLLFAMLFKWFPDAEIAWPVVWPGAIATALLFNVGKLAISWYIGSQGLQSTYGAASSIVVLLVWVYYSALIVLFGAELTHAYGQRIGSRRKFALQRATALSEGRSRRSG